MIFISKSNIFISKSFRIIVLFFFFFFFHNVSVAVPTGLPQVSPVYLGIEMFQEFERLVW